MDNTSQNVTVPPAAGSQGTVGKGPEAPESSTTSLPLIAIALLAILGVGGYYLYEKYGSTFMTDRYREAYDASHEAHHIADYDTSIASFESLLSDAPSETDKAHVQSMLAFDLYMRNRGDDRDRAMAMYKGIIADASLPARSRALILADLALLMESQTPAFVASHFTEAPFSDFLPQEGAKLPMTRTMLEMFKHSDELFPNSLAEYGIAYAYAALMGNTALPEGSDKEVIAQLMQDYVVSADGRVGEVAYEESHIARQRLFRALALGASGRFLSSPSVDERDAAYRFALGQAGELEDRNYQVRAVLMQTRFFYASFLLEFFGEDRATDTAEVLKEFGRAVDQPERFVLTRGYFGRLYQGTTTNFIKERSRALATVSPEFKRFTETLGLAAQ